MLRESSNLLVLQIPWKPPQEALWSSWQPLATHKRDPSSCTVGVSSPYPSSVFCYYSLLFFPFPHVSPLLPFVYLKQGARSSHSYQTVTDEGTRYCYYKDFLLIVPRGGKLCPAASNGFKFPSVGLTATSNPQEQPTTRPHYSTREVVYEEDQMLFLSEMVSDMVVSETTLAAKHCEQRSPTR